MSFVFAYCFVFAAAILSQFSFECLSSALLPERFRLLALLVRDAFAPQQRAEFPIAVFFLFFPFPHFSFHEVCFGSKMIKGIIPPPLILRINVNET